MRALLLSGLAALTLTACGTSEAVRSATTAPSIAPVERPSLTARAATALHLRKEPPAMRWGDENPEWTVATLDALETEGVALLSSMPSDVLQYCPGYATASRENRAAFWAGLLSNVVTRQATGGATGGVLARGGGKALSLMGLSSVSRRAHGCGGGAEGGEVVLRCAVKVMAAQVGRDNAIAGGSGSRWLGAAREWLPLRSAQSRADIAGWTRQQSYCR
ncbi:lytic transglycosylase [Paracoccus sanguinis]|uniref:lytic transglycosylase n=1 Tax=Paracoccus sanguinis TaxID=1545044 RepID=UPI0014516DDE|nr:lytic transglycosylase [Paracoccus sanguinis]QJD15911.1 lytic transglycosylase [Paracoccus sanguinis]